MLRILSTVNNVFVTVSLSQPPKHIFMASTLTVVLPAARWVWCRLSQSQYRCQHSSALPTKSESDV